VKRSALKSSPDKVREFTTRGRASSVRSLKHGPVSPASLAQRIKTRDRLCLHCGALGCDPAHLTPRTSGGCSEPACVIPLCRTCHRDFDDGRIDLEPILALPQLSEERSHMAGHMSLRQCIQRLTGERT
jgi:hypothetical protein